MSTRLNKFLAQSGICSRREADRLIAAGQVTINSQVAVMGQKVNGDERIRVSGKDLPRQKKKVYLAYHKPVGIICSTDTRAKDNIIEAIDYPERIFPVGRLDVASSGLILLTNDGDIVNRILRAEGKHEKEYIVRTEEPISKGALKQMAAGVVIDGRRTLPAKVQCMGPDLFSITLVEGRNRQIRKMCEAVGSSVKSLKRIRIMHIKLDNIPPGKWRNLTDKEEKLLFETIR